MCEIRLRKRLKHVCARPPSPRWGGACATARYRPVITVARRSSTPTRWGIGLAAWHPSQGPENCRPPADESLAPMRHPSRRHTAERVDLTREHGLQSTASAVLTGIAAYSVQHIDAHTHTLASSNSSIGPASCIHRLPVCPPASTGRAAQRRRAPHLCPAFPGPPSSGVSGPVPYTHTIRIWIWFGFFCDSTVSPGKSMAAGRRASSVPPTGIRLCRAFQRTPKSRLPG